MSYLKSRRNLIIGALVLGVAVILSYRFGPTILQSIGCGSACQAENDPTLLAAREVSAVRAYETPKGTDKVRFTLSLDSTGAVTAVQTTDVLEGDTVSENLREFSDGLLLVLRGKKLSELKAVDRVGKSSLTTAAFNAALPDLKKQL